MHEASCGKRIEVRRTVGPGQDPWYFWFEGVENVVQYDGPTEHHGHWDSLAECLEHASRTLGILNWSVSRDQSKLLVQAPFVQ